MYLQKTKASIKYYGKQNISKIIYRKQKSLKKNIE